MDRFVKKRSISGDSSSTRTPSSACTSVSLSDEERAPAEPPHDSVAELETQQDDQGVKELKKMLIGLEKFWQHSSYGKREASKKSGSFNYYGKAKCMQKGCKSVGSYNTQSRTTLKVHYDNKHKSEAQSLQAAMADVSMRGKRPIEPVVQKPRQMSMEEAMRRPVVPKPTKEQFRVGYSVILRLPHLNADNPQS